MRVVVDTNVVIAGMLWHGPPRRLLEAAIEGTIRLATSAAMIQELAQALSYPKLAGRLSKQRVSAGAIVARYALMSDLFPPASIRPTVLSDPDDDQVLACALAAKADLIVSGDSDLLNLKTYQGIPIVGAAQALARLPQR
jgi:putative PIN family toxin of toxin-antitoxin system